MGNNNVLILTLGKARKADGLNDNSYVNAKYIMPESSDIVESPFVAEPLIKSDHWNKIVIIGTVKSSWSDLYMYFAENPDSDIYDELEGFEEQYGINTNEAEMDAFEKRINEVYNQEHIFSKIAPYGIPAKVILTFYGVNKDQLQKNYARISTIKDSFTRNDANHVSFDITHSFRSLPIYNLVILNYLQKVSSYNISIDHIYYGNLEFSRENDGISQIVDLANLINVMELTSGVSEFKNTGSAVTLTESMGQENQSLKNAIEEFEWATQLNSFSSIKRSLLNLLEATDSEEDDKRPYADLKQMIEETLEENMSKNTKNFFRDKDLTGEPAMFHYADEQYVISKWYYKQHRYGEAIATALEALRSYLTIFVIEDKSSDTPEEWTIDALRKEDTRKIGEDYLTRAVKLPDDSEEEKLLRTLNEQRLVVRDIRNVFAHILENDNLSATDSLKAIDDFMRTLDTFSKKIRPRKQKFNALLTGKLPSKGANHDETMEDLIVVTSCGSSDDGMSEKEWGDRVRQSLDAYIIPLPPCRMMTLPKNAAITINADMTSNDYCNELYFDARLLADYLKRLGQKPGSNILLLELNDVAKVIFTDVLAEKGYENIFYANAGMQNAKRMKKIRFVIAADNGEDIESRLSKKRQQSTVSSWLASGISKI